MIIERFMILGVSPALRFGVGLYATSPHLLRKLRAFRYYPSRRCARTYTYHTR